MTDESKNPATADVFKTPATAAPATAATVSTVSATAAAAAAPPVSAGEYVPYKGRFPGSYVPGSDWRIWLNRFENVLTLRKVQEELEKRLIFLEEIGPENYGLLESLLPGKKLENESYKTLTDAMTERFKPKVLLHSERYRMMHIVQKPNQSLVEFVAEIQNAAKTCEFEKVKDTRDLMVTMTFLTGLGSEETRKRLMEQSDKTSLEMLALAEAFERVGKGAKEMHPGNGVHEVDKVDHKTVGKPQSSKGQRGEYHKDKNNSNKSRKGKSGKWHGRKSRKDDERGHPPRKREHVPFCHICRVQGHSTNSCRYNHFPKNKKAHVVRFEEEYSSDPEANKIVKKKPPPKCRVEVKVEGRLVSFELDTGAGMTLIGSQTWELLGSPKLNPPDTEATAYDGKPLSIKGMWEPDLEWGGSKHKLCMYVMDHLAENLWGRDAIKRFKMNLGPVYEAGIGAVETDYKQNLARKVTQLLTENNELFKKELGTCKMAKAVLKFKMDKPEPRLFRARPVPYAVKPKVDEVLDRMVQEGSLLPIDHSDWATPLVVVPKPNGKVRLCGDFKVTVNPLLDINQYPLPKPEDMFHQLNGGQKFSKMDLKDAYTQVELDDDSKKYLVLNTQKGLFQYQRLPFGVASAPAIFQKIMEQTLSGIQGVLCYLDDITITAPNDEEHLDRLGEVLKRMRQAGFRLSREKCAFLVERMEFLGHVVDREGIRPSPEKIQAMLKMPAPKDVKQVEAFIGMVNYYGKFIPNLSTLAAPLNALRQKDAKFVWEKDQQNAFNKIKQMLTDADVLAHYDPQVPVILATDASEYGIGAVIYHKYPSDGKEKVIAYASRSLTKAEKNYGQIEKEALGIVYGVEKFSQFLYGRKFTLLTDHQPLVHIFGPKKELPVIAAKRVHRWALRLMAYVFDIEYRNTLEFGNADGLSRLPRLDELPSVAEVRQEDEVTRWARENLSVLPFTLEELIRETDNDHVLRQVRQMIRKGFPAKTNEAELQPYVKGKEELSDIDGTIQRLGRVVIPASLQSALLKQLHQNHYGRARMKALARLKVWYPKMDQQIDQMAKSCEICAVLGHQLTRTPLHPWEIPEKPWQRIHIDFCGPAEGFMWMVAVDAKSKWPEAIRMRDIKTETTIRELDTLFATHGVPEQIVSDNGPQLTSKEFANYCKCNNIEHLLTPPYHPNSNGEAERFVQTFKRTMEKGVRAGGKLSEVVNGLLRQYRATPHPATGCSPAVMLMGRQLRLPIDAIPAQKKEVVKPGQEEQYRMGMKRYHDKKSKEREFQVGERVYMRNPHDKGDRWLHAIIVTVLGQNRYEVHYGHGQRQCHADQLKKKAINWEDYESMVWRKRQPIEEPEKDLREEASERGERRQSLIPVMRDRLQKTTHRPQQKSPAPIPQFARRSGRIKKPPSRYVAEPASSSRGGNRQKQ